MGRRRPRSGIAGFPDRGSEDDGRVRKLALHGGDDGRVACEYRSEVLHRSTTSSARGSFPDYSSLWPSTPEYWTEVGGSAVLRKGPVAAAGCTSCPIIAVVMTKTERLYPVLILSPLRRYALGQFEANETQRCVVGEHIGRYRANQTIIAQINLLYVLAYVLAS